MDATEDLYLIYNDFLKNQFIFSGENKPTKVDENNKLFPELNTVQNIRLQAFKEDDMYTLFMSSLYIAEITRYLGLNHYANKIIYELNVFNKNHKVDEDVYSFHCEVSARMYKDSGEFIKAKDMFKKALKHANVNNHVRILILKEEQADCLLYAMNKSIDDHENNKYIKDYADLVNSIEESENSIKYNHVKHYLTLKRKLFYGETNFVEVISDLNQSIKESIDKSRNLDVINLYVILSYAYNFNDDYIVSTYWIHEALALSEKMMLSKNIKTLSDLKDKPKGKSKEKIAENKFYPVLESASLMF